MPADGETNVPTDVLPLYDAIAAHMSFPDAATVPAGAAPALALTAPDGTTIPVTASLSHNEWAELQPQTELAPDTQYTLSGSWNDGFAQSASVSLSLSFTTGSGPVSAAPAVPTASMQRYVWQKGSPTTDCDPNSQGNCIFWPPGTTLEAVYISFLPDGGAENDIYSYFYGGPFVDTGLASSSTPFTCVDLRTRAENGTLSGPQRLCASDFPVNHYFGGSIIGCSTEGITIDGQPGVPSSHGCDVAGTPGRARAPSGVWFAVVFVPVAWGRRVVRRRSCRV